jgi:hypothetical protein
MPKQREQQNDRQRDADEPEQNASSESHVPLLIVRNNKPLTNGRFRHLVRRLEAKRARTSLRFLRVKGHCPESD